jgi:hypothetical protein
MAALLAALHWWKATDACTLRAAHHIATLCAIAALGRLFKASFWQLMVLAAVAANGGTWGDTAILVTNVRLAAALMLPLG